MLLTDCSTDPRTGESELPGAAPRARRRPSPPQDERGFAPTPAGHAAIGRSPDGTMRAAPGMSGVGSRPRRTRCLDARAAGATTSARQPLGDDARCGTPRSCRVAARARSVDAVATTVPTARDAEPRGRRAGRSEGERTELTRMRQRLPRTLLLLLAMSGVPFRKTNNRPPTLRWLGPVSLWLPAGSSDQFVACGSMPPRMVAVSCSNPWCLLVSPRCSQPDYKQWQSNHREWQSVKRPGRTVSHVAYPERVEPLIDPFGRRVNDLRISITDRCNFRCTYCMPEEGMQWLDRATSCSPTRSRPGSRGSASSATASSRSASPAASPPCGPTCPGWSRCWRRSASTSRMTTQRRQAPGARARPRRRRAARINVSLDSLRPERFRALTRRDELDRVARRHRRRARGRARPVKVNCVVMRGVNDDEVVDLAAFGRERGVGVRFIEFMPLDARRASGRATQVVPAREILDASTPCSRSSTSRLRGRTTASTSSRPSGSATPTASATSG